MKIKTTTLLKDKLLLILTALLVFSCLLGSTSLLDKIGLIGWYGYIWGTIVYLTAMYILTFKLHPKRDRPRGTKLSILLTTTFVTIALSFGLFYMEILPLTGYGFITTFILGAFLLAIITDYGFRHCYKQKETPKTTP